MKHEVKIPESVKEKAERVKQHVQDNKMSYLIGGGCFVAGYLLRKPQMITVVNETSPPIAPVFNNMPTISPTFNNNNSSMVNFGGHLTKMVERVGDGMLWKKVKTAAEEIAKENEVPFERAHWLLSRHLNGHIPNVYSVVYRPAGVGTTG